MKFAIGIPTINRADLLEKALDVYYNSFPGLYRDIRILDNGKQDLSFIENLYAYHATQNMGVAMSWNILLENILSDHDYALILNDDLILEYGEDEFQEYINDTKPAFAMHGSGMCAFLISRETFRKIGYFDFNFTPAYFEDADYLYRMKLAGIPIAQPAVFKTREIQHSASIAKDPSLNDRFKINESYYQFKWGGLPGAEKYTTAFNL